MDFNNPHAVATSSYLAFVNEDKCTGCEMGYSGRCQVKTVVPGKNKARVLTKNASAAVFVQVTVQRCHSAREAAELPGCSRDNGIWGSRILKEKGKMEAFLEIMMKSKRL